MSAVNTKGAVIIGDSTLVKSSIDFFSSFSKLKNFDTPGQNTLLTPIITTPFVLTALV